MYLTKFPTFLLLVPFLGRQCVKAAAWSLFIYQWERCVLFALDTSTALNIYMHTMTPIIICMPTDTCTHIYACTYLNCCLCRFLFLYWRLQWPSIQDTNSHHIQGKREIPWSFCCESTTQFPEPWPLLHARVLYWCFNACIGCTECTYVHAWYLFQVAHAFCTLMLSTLVL